MASEFQGQFQDAMREAEMADLKKSMGEMTDAAKGITDFDPIGDVRKEVESFTSDPLGTSSSDAASEAAAASSLSPEAAPQTMPAPVAADTAIASAEAPVAPEAPQSGTQVEPGTEPKTEPKTGSGA
jgi:sec-independent protein translocase protein TatB